MESASVRVWGPIVRIGHWVLAFAFLIAFVTAGRPLGLHSRAGYLILAYIVGRIAWGVYGPVSARFWNALGSPRAVYRDFMGVVTGKPERYEGVGPVGGVLLVLLTVALLANGVCGIALLAVREGQGPLAPVLGIFYEAPPEPGAGRVDIPPSDPDVGGTTIIARTQRVVSSGPSTSHPDMRSGSDLKAVHGTLSWTTFWIVVAHVAWVVGASISRGENLLLSMVTGQRHAAPPLPPRPVLPATTKTAPSSEAPDVPPAEEPRRERGGGRARRREAGGGGGGGRRRRERD